MHIVKFESTPRPLFVTPQNLKQLGIVSTIVTGATAVSFGEMDFNLNGFLMQVRGFVFEVIRLVMAQQIQSRPAGLPVLLCARLCYFHNVGILTMLANATIAFLLNVSVALLIGTTSAVVMTLCGVLKDILLVVASIAFFRDPVTLIQAEGYSVSLGGLVYYTLGVERFKEAGS
ncbi:hypothetical protein SLS56_001821 [Neofusicoccum ribis]|uniref:GDP-mannose transporter n=1 Tax=Neofusicoccum ribis TaxID=45134 RepID=A0ABR3T7J8_9PEZI